MCQINESELARKILEKVRSELEDFAWRMIDIESPMISMFWKKGDHDDPDLVFMYPIDTISSVSIDERMWVEEEFIVKYIWDALERSPKIFTIRVEDWEIEGYFRGFNELHGHEIRSKSCCNYFALGKKKTKIDNHDIVLCIIWVFVDTMCNDEACTCTGIVTILGGILEIDGKPVKYVELLDRVEVEGGSLCT